MVSVTFIATDPRSINWSFIIIIEPFKAYNVELKKISSVKAVYGTKVCMLATFEDMNNSSDKEFSDLVESTKRKLGAGLVSYETGKHSGGTIIEFLGCQTPDNS